MCFNKSWYVKLLICVSLYSISPFKNLSFMSNTYNIQNQIRQNATDIRSYIDDLYSWEDERNNTKKTKPQTNKKKDYAIRGNVQETKKVDEKKTPAELQRDINTIPNYYKAWDQFDAVKLSFFSKRRIKNLKNSKNMSPLREMKLSL